MSKNNKIKLDNDIISLSKTSLVWISIFLLVVVFILIFIIINNFKDKNTNIIARDNDNSFKLTNPILDCEAVSEDGNSVVFSSGVNKKLEEVKNKYSVNHISLYFRDLNNGPWVGINEKSVFSPASLLKVPILIALLHKAEDNPSFLQEKIKIPPLDIIEGVRQNIKVEDGLIAGEEYTLSDVAEKMIQKSDNIAVVSILSKLNSLEVGSVFNSIGIPYKDLETEVPVRVKDYAGFFRVLFNASYLDREMSEKALEILTGSDYNNGIVAGVPEGTVVAHKYGERIFENQENDKQLHDCGIIYYPNKPYVLCIMTRGSDFISQESSIRELSRYVYDEVNKNSK